MGEWPLADRATELGRIRSLLADDTSRGVVIAAPPGIGKTRLTREVQRLATTAGLSTLWVVATRSSSTIPLGAFAPHVPTDLSEAGARPADRPDLLRRVAAALVRQAEGRRLGLFVDDAHLLDDASATLLLQMAMGGDSFLCTTIRTGESAPDPVVALWKDDLVERIDLRELEGHHVEELLAAVLGGPVDPGSVAQLVARSGGNVLYLRELVRGALDQDALRDDHGMWRLVRPLAPSGRLSSLISARLDHLDPAERRLLEVLACTDAIGEAEVDAFEGRGLLHHLEALGLISVTRDGRRLRVHLGHPLYGDVLRQQLPASRQQEVMRTLAETVELHGSRRREDVLRVGTWRLVCGGPGTGVLLEAAQLARWRFDLPLAERLAQAAVQAGSGFDAKLLLAKLQGAQGRGDQAAPVLRSLVEEAVTDRDRARLAMTLLDAALHGQRVDESLHLAEVVAAGIGEAGWRQGIEAFRVSVVQMAQGFGPAARAMSTFIHEAEGANFVGACLTAAYTWARNGRTADAIDIADRGRATHLALDRPLDWQPWMHDQFRCLALAYAGRLDQCEAEALHQHRLAVERSDREGQGSFALVLAHNVGTRGNVRSAARYAREAVSLSHDSDRPLAVHLSLVRLGLVLALAGDHAELTAVLRELDGLGPPSPLLVTEDAEARAWAAVAAGDLPTAAERFRAGAGAGERTGDLVGACSLLHALARVGHAKEVGSRLADVAVAIDGELAPVRVQHTTALVSGDPEALESAAERFEAIGAHLLAAEAAADAAVAWQRAGAARRRVAAEHRAGQLAQRCEGVTTPALHAVGGRAELTPAERETALLAASGRTDREIADQLCLSIRTVQNRLYRVYTKLGVTGRRDLAAALEGSTPRVD